MAENNEWVQPEFEKLIFEGGDGNADPNSTEDATSEYESVQVKRTT